MEADSQKRHALCRSKGRATFVCSSCQALARSGTVDEINPTPEALSAIYDARRCPVCGVELALKPWDGDSQSDEICPGCGTQFGYDDFRPSVKERLAVYSDWRRSVGHARSEMVEHKFTAGLLES